jgi:hypothetical protein
MSRRLSDLDTLSGIVPAGALGISLLRGSTVPCDASDHPTSPLPSGTGCPIGLLLSGRLYPNSAHRLSNPGKRMQ